MIGQLGNCRRAFGITGRTVTHEELIELYATCIMNEMERLKKSGDEFFVKSFEENRNVS